MSGVGFVGSKDLISISQETSMRSRSDGSSSRHAHSCQAMTYANHPNLGARKTDRVVGIPTLGADGISCYLVPHLLHRGAPTSPFKSRLVGVNAASTAVFGRCLGGSLTRTKTAMGSRS